MKITGEATENYLKAVYQLAVGEGRRPVSSGEVAKRVGVAPATATLMLKRLAEHGFIRFEAYAGASLTRKGKRLALKTIRRHRLIELFLVETLGMAWDEVHDEAERMEHAVSDALIDRIDEYLGTPAVDPHGAPIPRHDGSLPEAEQGVRLAECPTGTGFTLKQVSDHSPELLRYLSDIQLEVGSDGKVLDNCPQAKVVAVQVAGETFNLSHEAAQGLWVEVGRD